MVAVSKISHFLTLILREANAGIKFAVKPTQKLQKVFDAAAVRYILVILVPSVTDLPLDQTALNMETSKNTEFDGSFCNETKLLSF